MNKLILTIDTEGPRGSDPVLYQIWGKVGEEYYGIPKIIEICDQYSVTGLFFVDIPEIYDCGYEKIKEVVLYILEKGHDVGMHIHPHHFPDETRHFLFDYSYDEQYEIIKKCTDAFVEMTGKPPVSFRAGKYGANYDTLKIIDELGYKYDFSEFYSQKWCGINPPLCYTLPVKFLGLTEFPVTVFESLDIKNIYHRYDKLEITDNPNELLHVLKQYLKLPREGAISLFLHSFSFLDYLNTPDEPKLSAKRLNNFKRALKKISCLKEFEFVSENDLMNIPVAEKDSQDNIVKTKGIFRQLLYSFIRLKNIEGNKKASLVLYMGLGLTTVLVLLLFLLLWRLFS